MKRMGSSNVLVVGLKGLGVEIGEYNNWFEKYGQRLTTSISQEHCPCRCEVPHAIRSCASRYLRPILTVLPSTTRCRETKGRGNSSEGRRAELVRARYRS